jgi:hypothetical protein
MITMKSAFLALCLGFIGTTAIAQTTNCQQMGNSINCQTSGGLIYAPNFAQQYAEGVAAIPRANLLEAQAELLKQQAELEKQQTELLRLRVEAMREQQIQQQRQIEQQQQIAQQRQLEQQRQIEQQKQTQQQQQQQQRYQPMPVATVSNSQVGSMDNVWAIVDSRRTVDIETLKNAISFAQQVERDNSPNSYVARNASGAEAELRDELGRRSSPIYH